MSAYSPTFWDPPTSSDSSIANVSDNPWNYMRTCEETRDNGLSYVTKGYSKGYLSRLSELQEESPRSSTIKVQGVDIELLRPPLMKHINSYCIRRVVSPFEFYMEEELDMKNPNMIDVDKREQQMQAYYNNQDLQSIEYNIHVTRWKCYIYQEPMTGLWCRVRVMNFVGMGKSKQALLYFCDSGRQIVVPCESLRRLDDKFKDVGTNLLRCYLYDVVPNHGDLYWPIDAALYFKELVENKCFNAIVMKMSEKMVQYSPQLRIDCGVVLMSKNQVVETVNWTIVNSGYALSSGIMASSPEMLYLPDKVPSYNWVDKSTGVAGNRNSLAQVPLDKLREITARAMKSGVDVSKPLNCEHPPATKPTPENFLPAPLRDRLAWLKLSYVKGPSKIFVHMQLKYEELQQMNKELKTEASDLPPPELKIGALLACEIKSPKTSGTERWCRGVIKSEPMPLEGDNAQLTVEVLLVDYGIVVRVPSTNIHGLPDMFRRIPSFAHRVHLKNVRPMLSDSRSSVWSRYSDRVFYKYLMSFELKQPLYYAYMLQSQDKITLTDIDQDICFNSELGKWVAGSVTPSKENVSINSLADDPLLASHFYSYAVNIQYEFSVKEHEFWRFDDLSEFLIEKENGVLVVPMVSKNQIHKIICDGVVTV
ncbi:unnamed protein product [Orchesella dallaii]|uniref:Tudor domain-containing protein n=1 Tax=Orchesella dallaii TaxID=48710 RepID=A0ABP1S429_9HEXA